MNISVFYELGTAFGCDHVSIISLRVWQLKKIITANYTDESSLKRCALVVDLRKPSLVFQYTLMPLS
jgi:hypothetical protein